MSEDIDQLRLRFWNKTIVTVVELIHAHCDKALLALDNTPFIDISVYAGWVHAVAGAADLALAEKQRTEDFISAYSGHLLS